MRFWLLLFLIFLVGCQSEEVIRTSGETLPAVVEITELPDKVDAQNSLEKVAVEIEEPVEDILEEEVVEEEEEAPEIATDEETEEEDVVEVIEVIIGEVTYPWHENVLATQFGIGVLGPATAWDCHAQTHYGGVDNVINRSGWHPLEFTPKENPFYVALPYTDIGPDGAHKQEIPWYDASVDAGDDYTFLKNRWVAVQRNDVTCYAQWEDCLPKDNGACTAFSYVFGADDPTYPGIDISPAMSDCLGMDAPDDLEFGHSDDYVSWQFVDDVPAGPWLDIVTTSGVDWVDC